MVSEFELTIVGMILGVMSVPFVLLLWEKTGGKWLSRRRWRKYEESATLFCVDPDLASGTFELRRGQGSL